MPSAGDMVKSIASIELTNDYNDTSLQRLDFRELLLRHWWMFSVKENQRTVWRITDRFLSWMNSKRLFLLKLFLKAIPNDFVRVIDFRQAVNMQFLNGGWHGHSGHINALCMICTSQ